MAARKKGCIVAYTCVSYDDQGPRSLSFRFAYSYYTALSKPNGLALSADERKLYLGESAFGNARQARTCVCGVGGEGSSAMEIETHDESRSV